METQDLFFYPLWNTGKYGYIPIFTRWAVCLFVFCFDSWSTMLIQMLKKVYKWNISETFQNIECCCLN